MSPVTRSLSICLHSTPLRQPVSGLLHRASPRAARTLSATTRRSAGRLQNKVAVITGASSSIGRAIAFAYSAEGAHIVNADLRETTKYQHSSSSDETRGTTHERIREKGGKAIFVETDVTKPESMEGAVKRAVEEYGRVDIMVNNAGVAFESSDPRPVWEVPIETWEKTQAVNSTGVFLGIKYASAQMIKQDPHPSGDRGWIVNISSILGFVGTDNTTSYCASKGAVINLSRAAALDCAPHRIHVNCVGPGYTQSSQTDPLFSDAEKKVKLEEKHPFRGLGQPEDLAKACLFLASEDAQWVTGVYLPVDGGYTAR